MNADGRLALHDQAECDEDQMGFPAPEAAALHACRVVKDNQLRDHIASSNGTQASAVSDADSLCAAQLYGAETMKEV